MKLLTILGISLTLLSGCTGKVGNLFAPNDSVKAVNEITGLHFLGLKEEGVSFDEEDDKLKLKWDSAINGNGVVKYTIYDKNFTEILGVTKENHFEIADPDMGRTFVLGVRAKDEKESEENKEYVVYSIPKNPPKFSGLSSAKAVSNSKIHLTWEPSTSSQVTGYNIYLSKDLNAPILYVEKENTSATIGGLSSSITYNFTARATTKLGVEDTNKVIKSATTLSTVVPDFAGVKAVNQLSGNDGLSQLHIEWEPAGGDVTGYQVYYSTKSHNQNFSLANSVVGGNNSNTLVGPYVDGVEKTSTIISGLEKGTRYYIVVRAFFLDNTLVKRELNTIEKSETTLAALPPPKDPKVLSISPKVGQRAGGKLTTIEGEDFIYTGLSVKIGSVDCGSISFISSRKFTCLPGRNDIEGLYDITVTNGDGGTGVLKNGYKYTSFPEPKVTNVDPSGGPLTGGTEITLTGTGFQPDAMVKLFTPDQSSICTNVKFISTNEIKCTTSAHDSGSVHLFIENKDTQTGRLDNAFIYKGPPQISEVDPTVGPFKGENTIKIIGSGFDSVRSVTLGGIPCTSINQPSAETIFCTAPKNENPGSVTVEVENGDKQKANLPLAYTYQGPPQINTISPNSGSVLGKNKIKILGSGFALGIKLIIDGTECIKLKRNGNAELECEEVPAHAEGLVEVAVLNPDNQLSSKPNAYTYRNKPTISNINPKFGPSAGGTSIVITGSSFVETVPKSRVLLNGSECPVTAASLTSLTCTTPQRPEGPVDVKILNPDEQEVVLLKGFYYTNAQAPTVTSVFPSTGPLAGGTELTITGENFALESVVTLSGLACTKNEFSFVSTKQIKCTTISSVNSPGLKTVRVTNKDNQFGEKANAFNYSATPPPKVTALSPNFGPDTGGNDITIFGEFFTSPGKVYINENLVNNCKVKNSTTIECIKPVAGVGSVPAGTKGTLATVKVENTDTQSGSKVNGYRYLGPITVTSVQPPGGSVYGGTRITVSGSGFVEGVTAKINGKPCEELQYIDAASFSCKTPTNNGIAGAVPIEVSVPTITPASLNPGFTYNIAPKIRLVKPNSNLATGGNTIVGVYGFNFLYGTTVKIDGVPCDPNYPTTFVSENQLNCKAPARSAGTYDVFIESPDKQEHTLKKAVTYGPLNWSRVDLVAGTMSANSYQDGTGDDVRFREPEQIAHDDYYIYIADKYNHVIRRFEIKTNEVITFAGKYSEGSAACQDGKGELARFKNPRGANVDVTKSYLFISDDCGIRKIDLMTQQVVTIGTGFSTVTQLDSDSEYVYAVEPWAHRVSKVAINGGPRILVAGGNNATASGGSNDLDGVGALASFFYPGGVSVIGNFIYVSDSGNRRIRKIDITKDPITGMPKNEVLPYIGTKLDACKPEAVGPISLVNACSPGAMSRQGSEIYYNESYNIYKVNVAANPPTVTKVLGQINGLWGSQLDGVYGSPGSTNYLSNGQTIFDNDLFFFGYYADINNETHSVPALRKASLSSPIVLTTLTGKGIHGSKDGIGKEARFKNWNIHGMIGGTGVVIEDLVYMTDTANTRLRTFNLDTTEVLTVSGVGGNLNGNLNQAQFNHPKTLAYDGRDIFIGDAHNRRIKKIDMYSKEVSNAVGNGIDHDLEATTNPDGIGVNGKLRYEINGMVSDGTYVYFTSLHARTIRRIKISNNEITTIAGVNGQLPPVVNNLYTTVDGVGSAARFVTTKGLELSPDMKTLYVADYCTIRTVDLNTATLGTVTTIVGTNAQCADTNGTGSNARLYFPVSIATDGTNLYVSQENNQIKKINIDPNDSLNYLKVTTLSGMPIPNLFSYGDKDGLLAEAFLYKPYGLFYSRSELYILEPSGIRKIH